jgi:ER membrane protein complex subunit 1
MQRLERHVKDLKNLPTFLLTFARRFVRGVDSTPSAHTLSKQALLMRDTFGFRQIIVLASRKGPKVWGLASVGGKEVWGRRLGGAGTGRFDFFSTLLLFF